MSVIVPAILPVSREDLEEKLKRIHGLVSSVQIDSVDGRFVTPATWPYGHVAGSSVEKISPIAPLPYFGEMQFEIDLMTEDPEAVIPKWIEAGASRAVLHAESTVSLAKIIASLGSNYGHSKLAPGLFSVGLALNVVSEISLIEPYLDQIDFIQFMGIAVIGKQGQPFDDRVLRKIAAFKKKHPDVPVQVDGGVSLRTAPALLELGVERLIVGSAIWNSENIEEQLHAFQELIEMKK